MEIVLDENCKQVLRNVFEWSDIDGDGQISRNDLKISTGLESDSDVDRIFDALKNAGGGGVDKDLIEYAEFCKGIMDFPLLLEQFKNEFVRPQDDMIEETEFDMATNEYQRDNQMEFLITGLKDAVNLYTKSFDSDAAVLNSFDNREDLLEALRGSLERLRTKYKANSESHMCLVNGSIELYLLVRDISRFHEEMGSDYRAEIREYQKRIDELTTHCEKISKKNDLMLSHLEVIENKAIKTTEAHSKVLEETKNLQHKLEKAENKEKDFKQQINNIHSVISGKEKEINQLEKDLRQLNSLKTIQEMTGTNGRSNEDMKIRRSNRLSCRQSVPLKDLHSPKKPWMFPNSNGDVKYQILANQIRLRDEKVKRKESLLMELEENSEKYEREIERLNEEIEKLREIITKSKTLRTISSVENRESIAIPSLFDELQLMNRESMIDISKSVVFEKKIIFDDKGCQTETEKPCQVSKSEDKLKVNQDNEDLKGTSITKDEEITEERHRDCCICF